MMFSRPELLHWLPASKKEMDARGWQQADVIIFSGDAYIDHPSFGTAVVARWLEKLGLHVAVVPQPNWRDDLRDFRKLGVPKLFFAVTSGNMDSMVNHYTPARRLRSDDAYSPGGKAGFRPDYATTVYARILKQLFPDTPVVLGGIEASLRRFAHYDYWSDSLKPSILADTRADLLIYGMAEAPLTVLIQKLRDGVPFVQLTDIPQTARLTNDRAEIESLSEAVVLHSFEVCTTSKKRFADNFCAIEEESNKVRARPIVEPVGSEWVIVNPPFTPDSFDLDAVYELPFMRAPHPRYTSREAIPAFEMIRHSVNTHRGCFGGCSFCTISMHQGKFIVSRSPESVLREVRTIAQTPGFQGTITDLGGPSANMYRMKGRNAAICALCKRPSCIWPALCPNLNHDHGPLTALYEQASVVPGVRNLFIGSGVRYDMLFDRNGKISADKALYAQRLITRHVSGRLKVAPEHSADKVLTTMRKPPFAMFLAFHRFFKDTVAKHKQNLQLIPYLISGHPGSGIDEMGELAVRIKDLGLRPEQVQDFTPTPMTLSSVIFYTGFDPYTGEKIYTPRTVESKRAQKAFFFWYLPENSSLVRSLLAKAGRGDLIRKLFDSPVQNRARKRRTS